MKKNKKIFAIVITIVFLMVAFSGCNENNNKGIDKKTVLVSGGEWESFYFSESFGLDTLDTFVFFDDGTYREEQVWYGDESQEPFCIAKTTGEYHLSSDKIYLDETKSRIWNSIFNEWEESDCTSYDWSLEIIDSNTVIIGGNEYTC